MVHSLPINSLDPLKSLLEVQIVLAVVAEEASNISFFVGIWENVAPDKRDNIPVSNPELHC